MNPVKFNEICFLMDDSELSRHITGLLSDLDADWLPVLSLFGRRAQRDILVHCSIHAHVSTVTE